MSNEKKQPAPANKGKSAKGKPAEPPVAKGEGGKAEGKDTLIVRGMGRPILGSQRPTKPVERGRGAIGLGQPPPEDQSEDDED